MAKRFNRKFTLTDGNITRNCCFKIPNAATGIKIAQSIGGETLNDVDLEKLANIAASHLILLKDSNYPEQEITGLEELEFVFSHPFIGIMLVKEFQDDLAPLLEGLGKA